MSNNEQVETSQENTEEVSAAETLYPEGGESRETQPEGEQEKESPAGESSKETKPEGEEKPAEGEESKEGEAEGEADKEVEYDLKMPEGTMLEESVKDEIVSIAKEQGLSNENAQKLLDMQSAAVDSFKTQAMEAHHEQLDSWYEELRVDKEVGGDNITESAELAKRAVIEFGGEEFLAELNDTGYANHPGLFKMLVNVGREIEAGSLVLPGAQPNKPVNVADVFYPTTKQD